MKKIALFILLLFTVVQVMPAVQSFCHSSNVVVFNVDEEKNNYKQTSDEVKEKKDCLSPSIVQKDFSNKILTAIHRAEKILPYPCLEKLTPPPNFC